MTDDVSLTEIVGTIEKVLYKNPTNGFSVIVVQVNRDTSITATGTLTDIFEGEAVSLKGQWRTHQKFGSQFEISEYHKKLPTSAGGIQKYLASGMIKGIGPKFAERLVTTFGSATLEIIDREPDKLLSIPGVGIKRVDAIVKAWQEQKEVAKVMVFLREKDVPTIFAVKIFKTYGQQALTIMEENPYRLVDDIWGVGFKTADRIALNLGLARDSLARIKAGILYTLTNATSQGHLYLELTMVQEQTLELLTSEGSDEASDAASYCKKALQSLYQEKKIIVLKARDQHYLSLPQYYYSEKGIAAKILKLIEAKPVDHNLDISAIYQSLRAPDESGFLLNEVQQEGIISCLQNKVSIITGGPGTGKTTLIKKMLNILEENKVVFHLAAPTGRAAKRMFESTRRHTETLHRLLAFSPTTMSFTKNEHDALQTHMLIIDEASMIDVFLMHAILRALPFHARLVLIGDIDQLPSVGAGNILNDLIASQKIAVVRLTQIFRQAQDSMIIINAHRVNNGEFPTTHLENTKKDFILLNHQEPENFLSFLTSSYQKTLARHHISTENSVVLVPMNRGVVGTYNLNQVLQRTLNPGQYENKQVMQFGQLYKVGDRVMQIKNNYDKFTFNGDIGTITDISLSEQTMLVTFGERELSYEFNELNELVLSYAISIHKSQGSEFDAVIIPIFMQHFVLLQRNLIYTAITRAKKLCILVGQPKAIAMAIKNNKAMVRNTFLQEFLTSDLEAL